MKYYLTLISGIFFYVNVACQVTCNATGSSGSGYPAFINAEFGIENPDCEHADFGAHITQIFDTNLDRNVFVFHSHIILDHHLLIIFFKIKQKEVMMIHSRS